MPPPGEYTNKMNNHAAVLPPGGKSLILCSGALKRIMRHADTHIPVQDFRPLVCNCAMEGHWCPFNECQSLLSTYIFLCSVSLIAISVIFLRFLPKLLYALPSPHLFSTSLLSLLSLNYTSLLSPLYFSQILPLSPLGSGSNIRLARLAYNCHIFHSLQTEEFRQYSGIHVNPERKF